MEEEVVIIIADSEESDADEETWEVEFLESSEEEAQPENAGRRDVPDPSGQPRIEFSYDAITFFLDLVESKIDILEKTEHSKMVKNVDKKNAWISIQKEMKDFGKFSTL